MDGLIVLLAFLNKDLLSDAVHDGSREGRDCLESSPVEAGDGWNRNRRLEENEIKNIILLKQEDCVFNLSDS